jgi:hypothetical protein
VCDRHSIITNLLHETWDQNFTREIKLKIYIHFSFKFIQTTTKPNTDLTSDESKIFPSLITVIRKGNWRWFHSGNTKMFITNVIRILMNM